MTATRSTQPRSLADRFAEEANVKDFGAAGDGTTDDTRAIQAAIDAAAASVNGGIVVLPPGHFKAGGLFIRSSKVHFRGAGRTQTIIVGPTGSDVLTIECPAGTTLTGLLLQDFQVQGGERGIVIRDAPGASGISGITRSQFRRILVTRTNGAGIYVGNDLFMMLESTFEQVYVWGGTGSVIAPRANHLQTFFDCQWKNSTGPFGLFLANAASVRLVNNLWETNARTALAIDRSYFTGVTLDGGWFENNATTLAGGPYPLVTIERTAPTPDINPYSGFGGPVAFLRVHMAPQKQKHQDVVENDGGISVKVLSDNVVGPLVFDDCNFLESNVGVGLGAVDLGRFPTKASVQIRGTKLAPRVINGDAYRVDAQSSTFMTDGGRIVFSGRGPNDFLVHGPEQSATGHTYDFEIDGVGDPNTFRWRVDGGPWTSRVPVSTQYASLVNGITYRFRNLIGHVRGDRWTATTYVTNPLRLRSASGVDLLRVLNDGTIFASRPYGTATELSPDGSGNLEVVGGAFKGPLVSGPAPASVGAVRLSNGEFVTSRSAGNGRDQALIGLARDGRVTVGDGAAPVVLVSNLAADACDHQGQVCVQCVGTSPTRRCSLVVYDSGGLRTIVAGPPF